MLSNASEKQYKNLEEQAYNYLKTKIKLKEILPFERIIELSVAEKLEMSRTPIRRAIRKLEKEHYVTIESNKGAIVNPPLIDKEKYIQRVEFIELMFIHVINHVEAKNISLDVNSISRKVTQMNEYLTQKNYNAFFAVERSILVEFLEYGQNDFMTEMVSQTHIELVSRSNEDIKGVMKRNATLTIPKLVQVIGFMAEQDFIAARKHVRMAINHLLLAAIR